MRLSAAVSSTSPSTVTHKKVKKAVMNQPKGPVKSSQIKPKVLNEEKVSKCETKQDSEEIDMIEFNRNVPKETPRKTDFTLSLDLAAGDMSSLSNLPRGSMNSVLSMMNFSKSVLNCSKSNLKVDCCSLGEKLKSFLLSQPVPNVTIVLPKETLEVDELIIEKNVTFVGSPEAKIKVTKGSIHVKGGTVAFRECEVILARCDDPNAPREMVRRLFEVYGDTELELTDCMLTLESVALLPESELNEIAIYVHSQVEDKKPGTLVLNACSFMRFFNHIIVGKNSGLSVRKCGFAQSKNSSIVATGTSTVLVADSTFTGIGAHAIEARVYSAASEAYVLLMFNV